MQVPACPSENIHTPEREREREREEREKERYGGGRLLASGRLLRDRLRCGIRAFSWPLRCRLLAGLLNWCTRPSALRESYILKFLRSHCVFHRRSRGDSHMFPPVFLLVTGKAPIVHFSHSLAHGTCSGRGSVQVRALGTVPPFLR
jgi:hypothetical protein